jgi:soluble lytic murein transglycosylase-like protein
VAPFLVVGAVAFMILFLRPFALPRTVAQAEAQPVPLAPTAPAPAPAPPVAPGSLSPLFTPEIQQWKDSIVRWAAAYELDPNLVATVMQIESCGNPLALSSAGARGLFQVMPFHFQPGEDMNDPETNARRGLAYLKRGLELANGDAGLALAGYNGGHSVIRKGWSAFAAETRRYYRWGSGLYAEASSNAADSATLADWLNAGGSSLCRSANAQLNLN